MKRILLGAATVALLLSIPAIAGAIKTWTNGDNLTASDLNANFQHIHNAMVGGHGARLVDSDVNASANISCSKLNLNNCSPDGGILCAELNLGGCANPQIPRAWANVGTCVAGDGGCARTASYNVKSVTEVGTGQYFVDLSYTATDSNYLSVVSSNSGLYAACSTSNMTTTQVTVKCFLTQTSTLVDDSFNVLVFDDN